MQIFVLFYLKSVCFFSLEFAHEARNCKRIYTKQVCVHLMLWMYCVYIWRLPTTNNKIIPILKYKYIFFKYFPLIEHLFSTAYALTEPHTMLLLLGRTQLVATVALLLELLWMKSENETEHRSAQLRLSLSVCVCVCVAVLPTIVNCRWKSQVDHTRMGQKKAKFLYI